MNPENLVKVNEKLSKLQESIVGHIISHREILENFLPSIDEKLDERRINFALVNNGDKNLHLFVHKLLVHHMIYDGYFRKKKIDKTLLSQYFHCFADEAIIDFPLNVNLGEVIGNVDKDELYNILVQFHKEYLNTRLLYRDGRLTTEKARVNFRDKGSVYTPKQIAREITLHTMDSKIKDEKTPNNITVLDFGCGTGEFYLNALEKFHKNLKKDYREIIDKNIVGKDIDPIAIDILRIKLFSLLDRPKISDLEAIVRSVRNENLLIREENIKLYPPEKYDVIVSNPPYFLLKVNKDDQVDDHLRYFQSNLKERIQKEVEYFRKSSDYILSDEGMLNYYKLSIEAILKSLADGGRAGIICPATLFADISSAKLRRHILINNTLNEIEYFPESANLFENITQATVVFYFKKGGMTDNIKIRVGKEVFKVPLDLIEKVFKPNYEIPLIDEMGWSIIRKISNFKKLKDFHEIRNRRGELDVTKYRQYILHEKTEFRLVRGNMISSGGIIDKNQEYVSDVFLTLKSSDYLKNDFNKNRLVCQQICNSGISKRLNFVLSEKSDIIANSCNYLVVSDNIDINKLRILLNSYLMNWRFKITSSNNHINNYEIDELPLPELSQLPDFCGDELENNILISKIYGLTLKETEYVLDRFFDKNEIREKWERITYENIQSYHT